MRLPDQDVAVCARYLRQHCVLCQMCATGGAPVIASQAPELCMGSAQFEAFARGFMMLCGGPAIHLFSATELERLVCGNPLLDFRALQASARYDGGYHAEHKVRLPAAPMPLPIGPQCLHPYTDLQAFLRSRWSDKVGNRTTAACRLHVKAARVCPPGEGTWQVEDSF